MYKQRFITLFMTIIMMMTTTVYADDLFVYPEEVNKNVEYPQGALKINISETKSDDNLFFSLNSTAVEDFETYIKTSISKHQAAIDVSMYNMKVGNFIAKVSEYCDELMVATGLINCQVESTNGIPVFDKKVKVWRPVYLFSAQQQEAEEQARTFVRQEVLRYADEIRTLTDDPLGQLLLVHDMLIKNCEYDYDSADNITTNNIQSYSAYGLFKNKMAVCHGYSEAFYLITKELGFDCGFYISHDVGHTWNCIKVDNEFYQVDVTWNDTAADEEGEELAIHEFFLASDAKMAAIEHGEKDTWYQSMDTKPDCGEKYEGGYLFNIAEEFTTEFIDGKYVVNTTLVRNNGGIVLNETFKTSNLYTGASIPSVITSDDASYYCTYYFTKPTQGFDLYLGQYKADMLLSGVKMGTVPNLFGRGSVFRAGLTKSKLISGYDNFKIFMWNRDSMTSLAVPASDI